MNNFINKIISLLSSTTINFIYSPNLKEVVGSQAAIQILPGSDTINTLKGEFAYDNLSFAVLVKGDGSDSNTAGLAYEVFNKLHNILNETFTGGKIIYIKGSTPAYVGVTDKEDIIYNVNFLAQVQFISST